MLQSLEEWHERFLQQSIWTASLRAFLFNQVKIRNCQKILEVGCGTGVITQSLHHLTNSQVFGLDILHERSAFARSYDPSSNFVNADVYHIPFASKTFDLTFCHYLLLWLKSPLEALVEMKRITRPGGYIVALAEPDYLSRMDAPESLIALGKLQTQSLRLQGAATDIGRHLPALFSQAGLKEIQLGASGFQNEVGKLPAWFDSEWHTLRNDLTEQVPSHELDRFQEIDRQNWLSGHRVLWVPTFYAIGSVP